MYKGNIIEDVSVNAYDVIPFKNAISTNRFIESNLDGYVKIKKKGIYLISAMVVTTDIFSHDASMHMLSGNIETHDAIASAYINNDSCYTTFIINDTVFADAGDVIAFSINESCTIQNAVLTVMELSKINLSINLFSRYNMIHCDTSKIKNP